MWPAFFSLSGGADLVAFSDFNAESATHALFLLELHSLLQLQPPEGVERDDSRYLHAALRALTFTVNEVYSTRRWSDFEAFWSCSPKPLNFSDPYTRQPPECNIAKIAACRAFLTAYTVTGNSTLLAAAERTLHYTLLTQQVWSHPLLSAKLLGGTTTQNTDAEWSDNRQNYLAVTLLRFYRATHKLEYLERGVAALRSSFAVAPFE